MGMGLDLARVWWIGVKMSYGIGRRNVLMCASTVVGLCTPHFQKVLFLALCPLSLCFWLTQIVQSLCLLTIFSLSSGIAQWNVLQLTIRSEYLEIVSSVHAQLYSFSHSTDSFGLAWGQIK